MSQDRTRKASLLGHSSALSLSMLAVMAVSAAPASAAPPLINTGTFDNNGNYLGDVTINFGTGVINNNSGGVWTGEVITNQAIINNNTGAIWNGNIVNNFVINNSGTLNNDGNWNGSIANFSAFINTANGTVTGLTSYSGGSLANSGALSGGLQVNQNTDGGNDVINNAGTIGGAGTANGVNIDAGITDLAITGAGTITGASVGILDQASGAGGITLDTGTGAITGKDTGISLTSLGAIALTSNGKIITAGGNGIDLRQADGGVGDITVTSNGAIASDPSSVDVVFNNGIKTNIADGSNANTTVNVNANIGSATDIGTNYGAFVGNGATAGASNTGNLNINITNASAYGQQSGLFAWQNGQGDITIKGTGTGTVLGGGSVESDSPIYGAGGQIVGGGAGAIAINLTQDAIGRTAGLGATTDGGGNISITTTGAAQGLFGDRVSGAGILALNSASAANSGTINITANGPVSGGYGIQTNSGQSTGQTTITINGEVSATQYYGFVCTLGECEFTAIGGTGIQATSTKGGITTNIAAGAKIDPLIGIDHITVSGALTINNAGLIQGDNIGVRLTSTGTGVVGDLTLAQTGTGAIQITNAGGGLQGAVLQSIDANLKVTGNGAATIIDGINAIVGLDLRTTGLGAISVSDNTIKGGSAGLRALQTGAATTGISVTGTGDISAITRPAVELLIDNAANTGNITYNRSGNITGSAGILAGIDTGRGSVNVTITGASKITSEFDAIAAYQDDFNSTTGDVTVTTSAGSTVASGILGTAIFAVNSTQGSGVVTVLNNAAIKSDGMGIAAYRQTGSGDTTVTNTGSIGSNSGPGELATGITAVQSFGATGNVTVNLTKANIGSATDVALAEGIIASSRAPNAGNVTVNLDSASIYAGGSADSGSSAIYANQIGKGNITVSGIGAGTISSANGFGINAAILRDKPGAITVDVTQDIISASSGIRATTNGTGNISINKTSGGGNITASFGDTRAIAAFNNSMTANAATIDITVGAGKLVSASRGQGIVTDSGISTGTTTITNNGDIKTADSGIQASSAGGIVINGIGSITSLDGTGIETSASGAADTKITLGGDVAGGGDGISAFTDGGGNIVIATGGNITAGNGTGISAFNVNKEANTGAISITLAAGKTINATGGDGIVTNFGVSTGTSTVTVNGEISSKATAGGKGGINGGTGIRQGSIIGNNTILIGATGKIDPLIGTDQLTVGGALTVGNAGLIQGDNIGVRQTSTGTGAVGALTLVQTGTGTIQITKAGGGAQGAVLRSVDANQIVTGNGASTVIDAANGTVALDLSTSGLGAISVADNTIKGKSGGIFAQQTGAAATGISVTGTGDISATSGRALELIIDNAANTGNITYNRSGNVSGNIGIYALVGHGQGSVNLTTTGTSNVSSIFAIQLDSIATTGDVTVTTAAGSTLTASGNDDITGIAAANYTKGSGVVTVLNNSAIKSDGDGISAFRSAGSGDVTVTSTGSIGSNAVPGSLLRGILVSNAGIESGNLTVNLTKANIGSASDVAKLNGIVASGGTAGSSGNVTVNLDSASIYAGGLTKGAGSAIKATQSGNGNVSVFGIGAGTISSANGFGISADIRNAGAGAITVDVAEDVVGAPGGIVAVTTGTGNISINKTSGGGNITASGGASTAITAFNNSVIANAATIDITVGAGKLVSAAGGRGIETDSGISTGTTTITNNGDIRTFSTGIRAASEGGIVINGTGSVTSLNRTGINTSTSGAGDTKITLAGNVSGDRAGISAFTDGGGNILIATGGNITAGNGNGISASNVNGAANTGAISITLSAGKTITATGGNGILTNSGLSTGTSTVTVNGEISSKATDAGEGGVNGGTGIRQSSFANNTILIGATGKIDPLIGTDQLTVSGANLVTVMAGGLITGDNIAVRQTANTTGTNTLDNAGTITGTAQQGVLQVVANGDALVKGSGIITGGTNAVEITSSGSGHIVVGGSNAITGGSGAGIAATADATGTGAITVLTTGGAIATTGGYGVSARIQNAANSSAILIDVAGKVSGASALFASTLGGGNITVNARGNLTGLPGEGIDIRNLTVAANTGAINVLLGAGAALTSSQFNGISAVNSGPSTGTTTIVSNGSIDAFLNGVQAVATGGDVNLTTTDTVVSRSNGTNALAVISKAATGNIDITASGALTTNTAFSVTGNVGIAATISSAANTGHINITTAAGAAIKASTGILALNKGSGTATIITAADIIATGAGIAVLPDATFPPVALSPGAAIITANGNVTGNAIGGILVVGGSANTINGAGNVSSAGGFGISVNSGQGATTITQGGDISGRTFGVQVNALGGGNITIATGGNVTATGGTGISAVEAFPGVNLGRIAITVAAGKLVSATGGNGITTNSGQSLGATTITVNGEVTAPGKTGVQAGSTKGNITLNVAATGKIDPAIGSALTTVDGALAVANAGLIQGDTTGVSLIAAGTGTASVVNAGTITGGGNAVSGSTNGTAFAITNSATGTLNGAINVTGSGIPASVFSNAGIWNATGGSRYSGNLVNSGTTNLAAAGTIAVLGNASNLGTLNLTNGATNNLVTVAGTYAGGGTLRVDANTATALADQLTITGVASGTTAVMVNETGQGVLPGGFLPIVTVTPGASAATFVDGGSNLSSSSILLERFGQSPTSTTQFGIIQTINPKVAILGGLSSFGSAVSSMVYEPVGPYVTAKINPGANQHQFGLWIRGGAGITTQTLNTTVNGAGINTAITSTQRTSHQLLQIGADYGVLNLGGHGANLHLGITGGAIDGNTNPLGGRVRYHANFAGGYAYFTDGGLSLDAIYNHEWRRYDVTSQSLFGDAVSHRAHSGADAGAAHISYRIGGQQGLALTPLAAISWSSSQIDPLALNPSIRFAATNDKGLVYSGGAKVSYRGTVGDLAFEPFVGARYRHNASNHEQGVFSLASPGGPVNFVADTAAWRNAAQYSFGLTGDSLDGRISAFATATVDDGSQLSGATFSIGARFNF